MRHAHANRTRRRFRTVEPFGQIVGLMPSFQDCGKNGQRLVFQQQRFPVAQEKMHVVGFTYPVRAVPNRVRERGIVVPWNEYPIPGERLQRIEGLADRPVGHGVGFENVAAHDNRIRAAFLCQPGNLFDCLDALVAQRRAGIARNVSELLAELPVGRMDEGHAH